MTFWRVPLDAQEIQVAKGMVCIIDDRCKGCGYCIEFCPKDILEFSDQFNRKGYHPPVVTKPDECVNCHYCEIICPGIRHLFGGNGACCHPRNNFSNAPKSPVMKPAVLTGEHFITGDEACAEGAMAAGCSFFGAYPITPATEVAEHMSERLPDVGGTFIQMEDEIAAMASILGASWTGVKTMTATSGPGFSLMMENIGLAVCTETPCVVVNVQRAGPSTGLPTQGGQGDMMQARWGSHGDYEIIALAPSSPQDCFYQTITAFNLSEKYRVPVLIMTDEIVGHMSEKVVIPEASTITPFPGPSPPAARTGSSSMSPAPTGWRPCRPSATATTSMSPV